ncbi:MAG TPA: glycerophosphodiester phosphodiesterase [Gammaproteobacteria bacterium]|nr:glycerophosphodiester phosphodiesterase [Gammaproteobacteria bacterium]
MDQRPRLIAHRGYPRRYPENTLEGIEAALKAGACFVEFDVQVTADGVPVLLHDASLLRTSGKRGRIFNTNLEKLEGLCVNEPKRFGKRFRNVTVPTLTATVELLRHYPSATAFVELKEESMEQLGREKIIKNILEILAPILERCVIISYDTLAIRCARAMGAQRIGWVIKKWDAESLTTATELVPDFLFCNVTKIPKDPKSLWRGPWQWALYDITRPKQALELAAHGVGFIETMAIGDMLKDPSLRSGACLGH